MKYAEEVVVQRLWKWLNACTFLERLALGGRVPKTAGSMAIVQSQPRLLDAALALGQGSAEIYSYSVTARHGDSRHIRASCKS